MFVVEWFNLEKLSELEFRKRHQIKISDKFAALENLIDNKDINRAWENIQENIKTSDNDSLGQYELKYHKTSFDEEYVRFIDQRKRLKCSPYRQNQSNENNLKV